MVYNRVKLSQIDKDIYMYLSERYQDINLFFLKSCLLCKNDINNIKEIFFDYIIEDDDEESMQINISYNVKNDIFKKMQKIEIINKSELNAINIYINAMDEIRKMMINNIRVDRKETELNKNKYINYLKKMW